MHKSDSKLAYGIDFGTTNSTVSVVDLQGKPQTLHIDPDSSNPSVMRSVIYVSPDMNFLFGKKAVDAYLIDVAEGKGSKKKVIETGRKIKLASSATAGSGFQPDKWVDEILEIEEFQGGRLFQGLKSALSSNIISHINLFGQTHPLEWVISCFLKEMKTRADTILGQDIDRVVLGRPVEYVGGNNTLAIQRMTTAATLAGFKEIKFEYEPVGAAYDYGLNITNTKTILIFDFGGGTLDISIFKFPEKIALANVGLPIGGDHFNTEIFTTKLLKYFGSELTYGELQLQLPSYIFNSLKNWYQISLLKNEDFKHALENFRYKCSNPAALGALKSLVYNNLGFGIYEEIERVKKELSHKEKGTYSFQAKDIDITEDLPRYDFEEIIKNDLVNITRTLEKALKLASLNPQDIDIVATTGGSSLIPLVRNKLIEIFGQDKLKSSDAFTSVAAGLSLRATEVF